MVLKLNGFRIKNFRSIIDTDWQNLSIDNITALIGQNESGKTSIIQAINSFFTGVITEYDKRSDNSKPEVSCSFTIEKDKIEDIIGEKLIHKNIAKFINNKNRINITRDWNPGELKSSSIKLEESEFEILFDEINNLKDELDINKSYIKKEEFIEILKNYFPEVILFDENKSLLPPSIDIKDIKSGNADKQGIIGVNNFLKIANISLETLENTDIRISGTNIERACNIVNVDFQEFWTQKIGKLKKIKISSELKNYDNTREPTKAGQPYLVFWVKDEDEERLYLQQRSKGVNWFLSFYLQLKAASIDRKDSGKKLLFIIDEPGSSLHARAQEDALKIFDEIRDKNIQIIYTTHSPHFLKMDLLYRILAVQRREEDDERSDTFVMDINKLSDASSNTLAPIYTLMGIDFSHQGVIDKNNNVILEEISAYYYLKSFLKLLHIGNKINFIPATGCTNIPQLVNLFIGWGLDYIVILDDEKSARGIYNGLKRYIFFDNDELSNSKQYKIKGCNGIEDNFTNNDFKKYIIEDNTIQYDCLNSEYLKKENISKGILSYNFYKKVNDGDLKKENLENETNAKIETLISKIFEMLKLEKTIEAPNKKLAK